MKKPKPKDKYPVKAGDQVALFVPDPDHKYRGAHEIRWSQVDIAYARSCVIEGYRYSFSDGGFDKSVKVARECTPTHYRPWTPAHEEEFKRQQAVRLDYAIDRFMIHKDVAFYTSDQIVAAIVRRLIAKTSRRGL